VKTAAQNNLKQGTLESDMRNMMQQFRNEKILQQAENRESEFKMEERVA
jgi:hypothetical protein